LFSITLILFCDYCACSESGIVMMLKRYGDDTILKTYKTQTSLRIDSDVLEKLTAIAKAEKRSVNAQIEYAVKENIRRYEAEYGPVISGQS
jgi:hypothetical protein